jgi:hypothetical protein
LGLPQSVREVVGRRIERLGKPTLKALSAAAVIGRQFDVELLLAITEQDEDVLLDLLEGAVAASVLAESGSIPGRFSFSHALIAHTLYEDLGTTRLARMHRRIAEALEEQLGADPGARVSELAHHWAKATAAVDLPKAISYARQAGERALAELAPDEGVRWFSQALEIQAQQPDPDPGERSDLLIGLGKARLQVGDAGFRETLLEAGGIASELEDGERAAEAAIANNRGQPSSFGQIDEERIAALERALELCGPDDVARSARLLALQAMELSADPDHERRHALANDALDRARRAGDPRALGYVLRHICYALWCPETLEQRLEMADEAKRIADQVGDPALRFWAANQEQDACAENFQIERIDAAWTREAEIAEDLGQPFLLWLARFNRACCRQVHGDLAEAEKLAEEASRIGVAAEQPDALMIWGAQLSVIRIFQGRGEEVIELVAAGVEENPRIPAWQGGLAMGNCWLGRWDEAAPIVAQAAEDRFERIPRDQNWLITMALYAEAAAQVDDRKAAAALYDLLEPWKELLMANGANCYGPVRTHLGLLAATLGRDEAADSHFARAGELMEGKEMPLWEARNHLGWADSLEKRGESDRAREEAAKALAHAKDWGYGEIERRAAALVESGAAVG